jgi:hypothetical protein
LIDEFAESLRDGPGSVARATIYTGPTGSGKTVMLNAVEDRARALGWAVISETATPGVMDRLSREHLPRLLLELGADAASSAVVSDQSAGTPLLIDLSLRRQIETATDALTARGGGLLLTVDQIHVRVLQDLRDFAVTLQHAFREQRNIAFAGTGSAPSVNEVMKDETLAFLRRAERQPLGPIRPVEVRKGLRQPFEMAGRWVDDDALEIMAAGTRGYPFMIQLVGSHTWRLHPDNPDVSTVDALEGVIRAEQRLGSLVYEPVLATLAPEDRAFLFAMSRDDGRSRLSDLQHRLLAADDYVAGQRLRLIAAQLIEPAGPDFVDFAPPFLREHVRQLANSER